jgi:hypothetical protein
MPVKTLKHLIRQTQTNLLNTEDSSLLEYNAVMTGKKLLTFWKIWLSMTTKTASYSQMIASIYQSKWCHMPEHMTHHQQHCENLKYHFETFTQGWGGGTFPALQ